MGGGTGLPVLLCTLVAALCVSVGLCDGRQRSPLGFLVVRRIASESFPSSPQRRDVRRLRNTEEIPCETVLMSRKQRSIKDGPELGPKRDQLYKQREEQMLLKFPELREKPWFSPHKGTRPWKGAKTATHGHSKFVNWSNPVKMLDPAPYPGVDRCFITKVSYHGYDKTDVNSPFLKPANVSKRRKYRLRSRPRGPQEQPRPKTRAARILRGVEERKGVKQEKVKRARDGSRMARMMKGLEEGATLEELFSIANRRA
uniref:Vps72/YL1 C-terminal domain-containing protein n=1 Tax=Chromera velia CCMP2878 TaxID=1169474 RepID=A0A0G4GJX8_9ALVE|mmetsp:Transcript_20986/g.41899  ORF Transcript_20986/g.41899 Transcript_20986/m.41899 type:complete len:257 (-) Transcript_20986:245-1015(-)|eukprot:Cvel_22219.t1-p1 / transcript=Cvel_22219.t1 / gene=Cvel_22219 / organism=Chromera_velia_CCMP2878 / gene_product=hypothetical protein / transcript_product=hypothetical protein / location=Cvel_scaffold2161:920-1687(-) / protein_length=256 / sequence_SO=supercontig / SO=protein_coding / is_pseudo=false